MLRKIAREFHFSILNASFLGVLLLSVLAGPAFAQAAKPLPPDVRLVLDVSGSMKRNDPNNLRQPAVELLVQLLPENSKAGVWTFGKWVNMLVPHKDVNLAWRESAQAKSTSINSVGLFTNIGEALEKAAYDHQKPGGTHRKHIIILTDGMVDIDKDPEVNGKEWRRIVDEVIPRLKAADFTVHTIALSDNADSNLLGKISLTTDGIAEIAYTADDLMKAFLKAFDVAAPAEEVPLSDNSFVIDSSIEEFTALIFRKNPEETTELQGPDAAVNKADQLQEGVKWHSTSTYDLITVSRPLEGEWLIKADMAPQSRITVVSNLNLRVKPLPNNVYKGQSLDVQFALVEDGKIIKRPDFLSLMKIDLGLHAGANESELRPVWSENLARKDPPASGTFRRLLPDFDRNGIYEVEIVVDGQTFERKFSHRFTVRQPFSVDISDEFKNGKLDYILTVKSFSNEIEVLKTEVIASLIVPDGSKKFIPLALTEMDTWRGKFEPEAEGDYKAEVRIKGQTKTGEKFDVLLENIRVNYSLDQGMVSEPESFFPLPSEEKQVEQLIDEQQEEEQLAKDVESESEEGRQIDPQNEEAAQIEAIPGWILYSMLGAGNVLLLGLGFLAYKKLTREESDEDILAEFSDEKIAEKQEQAPPQEEPEEEAEEPKEAEEETLEQDMEEPPMEDLEPAMPEEPEIPEEEPPMEEIDLDAPDAAPEIIEEPAELDDLEQMAMDEPEQEEEEEDEDDDMVNAMLKAQGLDLAEDELDDAISSLIDEMDTDGDQET